MGLSQQPHVWRIVGFCVPATVVGFGVIGLWVDWFALVVIVALLTGLIGVHMTSPHRFERSFAQTGLLLIGLPGLAVGLLFDPISIVGFIIETFSNRMST